MNSGIKMAWLYMSVHVSGKDLNVEIIYPQTQQNYARYSEVNLKIV